MTACEAYVALREACTETVNDPFDRHVIACIFAIAAREAASGGTLCSGLGMSGPDLRSVIEETFPTMLSMLIPMGLDGDVACMEDERCVRELLRRFRSRAGAVNTLLTTLIARRAGRPNHLWQDLGLANRGELSSLMMRHFAPLARRNTQDMKWKKFFYRMICREDGFSLCVAPTCSECKDFETCFGDESGESLLARAGLPRTNKELDQLAAS